MQGMENARNARNGKCNFEEEPRMKLNRGAINEGKRKIKGNRGAM